MTAPCATGDVMEPLGTDRSRPRRSAHPHARVGRHGVGTEILDHVEREAVLDVIAITDHERIDAAVAARRMAEDRGMRAR